MRFQEVSWKKIHQQLAQDVTRETLFKNASKSGWGRYIGVVKPTQEEWAALQEWYKQYYKQLDPKEQESFKTLILFIQNSVKGKYDSMIPVDGKSRPAPEAWDALGVYPTGIY